LPPSSECCLQPPAHVGSLLADFSTLKMGAIRSFETSVHTRSTRRHIPEDGILVYCNVFCLLKTPFRLVIGLFNNLQVVTIITDNTVTGLHTLQALLTNLFTLSSVAFTLLITRELSKSHSTTHSQCHCTTVLTSLEDTQ
jgi:hypothetical protein